MPRFELSSSIKNRLWVMAAAGFITGLLGLSSAPARIWPNFLISVFYAAGLGLGAGLFIATQYVSSAGWSVAFRRIPEAVTSILPFAGIGAIGLFFGIHELYGWSHDATRAQDEILRGKSGWLNEPFFIARIVTYFALWIWMSKALVKNSVLQDQDGNPVYTQRNIRNSVLFILLGVYTACLASVDLLMSLQPRWYSTVFGFLALAGMFQSSLAVITIVVVILRRKGYRKIFSSDHLYDLGRLLMSFSAFWFYMWISQHLLIWYSNIPEETSYYILRHFGGWGYVSFMNVLLNWLVPFVILLPRASKRSEKILLWAAVVSLIGHWVDLYIMVMPSAFHDSPPLGVWEVGPFAGTMALFFLVVFRSLGKRNLVPIGDPYLVESLPRQTDATSPALTSYPVLFARAHKRCCRSRPTRMPR